MSAGYRAAVAAWTDHLRDGGTEPWGDRGAPWATGRPGPGSGATADAVQLAVLHRLNVLLADHRDVRLDGPPRQRLVERVLGTARPGRGPVDVPLPWREPPRFGSPPRDPADVPVEQRLGLSAALLVSLLRDVPTRRPLLARLRRTPRRAALPPAFEVHGPPATAALVRAALPRATAPDAVRPRLALGLPLDLAMAEAWGLRVASGAAPGWPAWWRRRVGHDRLPPTADVTGLLARLRGRPGGDLRVAVGSDRSSLAAAVAEAVGAPVDLGPAPWDDLVPTEVLRRVANVAAGAVPAHRLPGLLATARPALAAPGAVRRPVAPPAWAEEAGRRARVLAERLAAADYPVHGDPGAVGEVPVAERPALPREVTLDRALLGAARLAADVPAGGRRTTKGARR